MCIYIYIYKKTPIYIYTQNPWYHTISWFPCSLPHHRHSPCNVLCRRQPAVDLEKYMASLSDKTRQISDMVDETKEKLGDTLESKQ